MRPHGCATRSKAIQLLTTDILARATMKNAAKCDTLCELQNSVNHRDFERILRLQVLLEACLFECQHTISPRPRGGRWSLGVSDPCDSSRLKCRGTARRARFNVQRVKVPCGLKQSVATRVQRCCAASSLHITSVACRHLLLLTSNQARLPAEFKHIIKRRKRN